MSFAKTLTQPLFLVILCSLAAPLPASSAFAAHSKKGSRHRKSQRQPATEPSSIPTPNLPPAELEKIEEGTVYFKGDLSPLKTKLDDLKFYGILRPQEGSPAWFLVSGKPCKDCPKDSSIEERKLYLYRQGTEKPVSVFVMPGKIMDPKGKGVLLDARSFYGRCVNGAGDAYVVFQREKVDRRHGLMSSVFIAQVGKDILSEKLIERRQPRIQDTLKRVKAKQCREVEGHTRYMTRKAIDFSPMFHNKDDDDDDDEDETPKENQTEGEIPSSAE